MQFKAILLSGLAAVVLVHADTTVEVSGSTIAGSTTIDFGTQTAAATTTPPAAASSTAAAPSVNTSNAAAGGFGAQFAGGLMAAGAVGAAMVL